MYNLLAVTWKFLLLTDSREVNYYIWKITFGVVSALESMLYIKHSSNMHSTLLRPLFTEQMYGIDFVWVTQYSHFKCITLKSIDTTLQQTVSLYKVVL